MLYFNIIFCGGLLALSYASQLVLLFTVVVFEQIEIRLSDISFIFILKFLAHMGKRSQRSIH